MKIDKTDIQILEVLRQDAKLRVREIAKKIGKPITTVHNRIKKLQSDGVIKNYTVIVDEKKLGKLVGAFVSIEVNYDSMIEKENNQEDIALEIKKLEGVQDVYIITGGNDLIIKVVETDIDSLNNFLINKLRKIPGVAKTQTSVILKKF